MIAVQNEWLSQQNSRPSDDPGKGQGSQFFAKLLPLGMRITGYMAFLYRAGKPRFFCRR